MKFQRSVIQNKVGFCLVLLFFGLMSASVTHAETYSFVTKWGSYGSDEGQFSSPTGVAVDSSGNVYVADKWNSRIQKFDSSGNFITAEWNSIYLPRSVTVDSSGNIYVTDDFERVVKFDSSGNFITSWGGSDDGEFYDPDGIAVDSSGNVYVADSGNRRIQKFDNSGNFITKWGSEGSGDGQFDRPSSVAVDFSGNVYVADAGNYRIQKFAKEKITPTITWSNPENIIYGTPLTSTQLNAVSWSWVDGTFVYTPAEGTVLSVGTHTLHVDFIPDDTETYTTASKDVTIIVLAQPVLTTFPGYINPPSDLDKDGLYEDINGNGILDFDDVVAYYDNMDWIEENVSLEFFDYNKNGLIDFDDVVKLYDML